MFDMEGYIIKRNVPIYIFLTALLCGLIHGAEKDTVLRSGSNKSVTLAYPKVVGSLAGRTDRAAEMFKSGVRLETVLVSWDRFEPTKGHYDKAYISEVRSTIEEFKKCGMDIALDFGFQYPPQWARESENWLYQNQYGHKFAHSQSGDNGINAVFNANVRTSQADYIEKVFEFLGTDFFAVRLGWGLYGELNYPHPVHGKQKNCYWAFDPIAQGKEPGLPNGILPCPVPGWLPGMPSPDHESARKFAQWYLDSLKRYHDWQIQTVRRHYKGELFMMLGSWMLRSGQLEHIIEKDLADTGNTEIQRGFDYARMIMDVRDPGYIIYCTWLDTPQKYCDDSGSDQTRWSPVKQFAYYASLNPLKLRIWGENTGRGTREDMELTFRRCSENNVEGIFWAFEEDLFSDNKHLASINDLKEYIKKYCGH